LPGDSLKAIFDSVTSIWADSIREARVRANLSQRDLAELAGTTQSVVGRIEAGLADPNVTTIERLLAAAGFTLRVELQPVAPEDRVIAAYKQDIDRTLLRENLRRTPEQRVRALQSLSRLATEARRAGRGLRRAR
jgi:transcriptional regulator with XRE-family HTH domain